MAERQIESLVETIRDLTSEAHPERERADGRMSRLGRAAVIVALFGGLLGGLSTFSELWSTWRAKPNLSVVLGNAMEIAWNRQQRILSFSRWLTLRNDGEVTGVIDNPPRVRLETSTTPAVELTEIQAVEKGSVVGFPLSVHARDSRDVQLTMSLPVAAGEPDFIKEGDYRLYLSLDTSSTPEAKVSCIQFGKPLIETIHENGHTRILAPDACNQPR